MNFITFSEMLGSKGKEISESVAAELEYSYFGEKKLFEAAERSGFLTELMDRDEKAPSIMEKFFSERPKIYLDKLQSVIYDEAKKGDIVFLGKGSQMLLNSFGCALHVLVTGSLENRIQMVMRENRVDAEVAKKIIKRSDHDRGGFLRFAFDENWLAPTLYDFIINTDKLNVESAVRMVVDAAKSDEIKTCGIESVNLLSRLSLERKVASAMLELGLARSQVFTSVGDIDTVRVYGAVHSTNEKEMIEERLKKIDEIKHLNNEINLIDMSWGA